MLDVYWILRDKMLRRPAVMVKMLRMQLESLFWETGRI